MTGSLVWIKAYFPRWKFTCCINLPKNDTISWSRRYSFLNHHFWVSIRSNSGKLSKVPIFFFDFRSPNFWGVIWSLDLCAERARNYQLQKRGELVGHPGSDRLIRDIHKSSRWFNWWPFSSPNWRPPTTFEGVMFSPSRKGYQQNCQGWEHFLPWLSLVWHFLQNNDSIFAAFQVFWWDIRTR